MLFSYYFFFLLGVILGSLITISSSSWLTAWVGFELNLISFIPLIFSSKLSSSSESGIKYFFVQSIGSMFILLGGIFPLFIGMITTYYFVYFSLLIKLGVVPFHLWFPSVMEGLSWEMAFILLTWQKLAPLILLASFEGLSLIILLTVMVGCLGGFNQTSLKKLMAYSSIMHMGWMLSVIPTSLEVGMKYYFVYFFFGLVLCMIFFFWNLKRLEQFLCCSMFLTMSILLIFLSMGGFPPMLGFFPKWVVINILLWKSMILAVFLIFASLVNLYFYSRLFYSSLFLSSYVMSLHSFSSKNEWSLLLCVSVSLMGGIFYPFFMI
uniref:NADH-ubiquinone oxidoreductase chain 2 n=1 Tax=Tityus serrulatus TaxID=6887 RepID=A0A0K1LW91_TITSE|nr:NADH dehydrogenase subunit 2 [Tityus serrulatus]AKU46802.1 NADH dehydrogenase subunit 2 [Tityus serrulatus]